MNKIIDIECVVRSIVKLSADLDALASKLDGVIGVVSDLTARCEQTESALATRLAKIEAMPDIAQRLNPGIADCVKPGADAAWRDIAERDAPAAPPPSDDTPDMRGQRAVIGYRNPPPDEEIVEKMLAAYYEEPGSVVSTEPFSSRRMVGMRAVLALLRARGSVIR